MGSVESKTRKTYLVTCLVTTVQRSEEDVVSSVHCTASAERLYKNCVLTPTSHHTRKQFQMEHSSKCETIQL